MSTVPYKQLQLVTDNELAHTHTHTHTHVLETDLAPSSPACPASSSVLPGSRNPGRKQCPNCTRLKVLRWGPHPPLDPPGPLWGAQPTPPRRNQQGLCYAPQDPSPHPYPPYSSSHTSSALTRQHVAFEPDTREKIKMGLSAKWLLTIYLNSYHTRGCTSVQFNLPATSSAHSDSD